MSMGDSGQGAGRGAGRGSGIGHQVEDGRMLYAIAYFRQRVTKPTSEDPYGRLVVVPGLQIQYQHNLCMEDAELEFRASHKPQSYVICAIGLTLGTLVDDDHGDVRRIDETVAVGGAHTQS